MFQSTHPGRGATLPVYTTNVIRDVFQSTHPGRGATFSLMPIRQSAMVSIHAPRAGCDSSSKRAWPRRACFNPRTPGGVRHIDQFDRATERIVSIHAPRAGCDTINAISGVYDESVSIHAPRAGCDNRSRTDANAGTCFNPRTPGGVRPSKTATQSKRQKFQSTHPGRGATGADKPSTLEEDSFNPRTPGGVRQNLKVAKVIGTGFNPRTPGGVRPTVDFLQASQHGVSIHAPRAGCDRKPYAFLKYIKRFNPRTPGGVRQKLKGGKGDRHRFQSTHPGRGATKQKR